MLKTWHKWFVCLFAMLFVSVFFMVDARFFSNSSVSSESEILEDLEHEMDNEQIVVPPSTDSSENNNQSTVEKIPNYKNAYTCLSDAYARFDNSKYYSYISVMQGTSMGFTQSVKNYNYYSDGLFSTEAFAYSDVSLGSSFYERTTAYDKENITRIKTPNVYRDNNNPKGFGYKLSNFEFNYVVPYEEQIEEMLQRKFNPILFRAQKGRDKQIKFDRTTSEKYYIISIKFDLSVLTDLYLKQIAEGSGATKINHKSITADFYVSKTTGQIMKYTSSEEYEMHAKGFILDVTYCTSIILTYYNSPIDVTIK